MSDGILLLDKPSGLSSNAALQRVRGLFGAHQGRPRRQSGSAGHRHAADLPGGGHQGCRRHPRRPQALPLHIALGARTVTGDAEGAVRDSAAVPALAGAAVEQALATFIGVQRADTADVLRHQE